MSAGKEKAVIPGPLLFLGGLATGVALGFGAEKLLEKTGIPRKRFRGRFPYTQEPEREPKVRPTGNKGLGEANKMPEGD